MARSPTALLIVRAWLESGSAQPLRATIRAATDTSRGFDRELTVAGVDDVRQAVDAWLADVLAAGSA